MFLGQQDLLGFGRDRNGQYVDRVLLGVVLKILLDQYDLPLTQTGMLY